jgi:hypothetical protein
MLVSSEIKEVKQQDNFGVEGHHIDFVTALLLIESHDSNSSLVCSSYSTFVAVAT